MTESQRDLLTRAASSDDGAAADLFAQSTIRSLIKRGYLISLPKGDGPSRLLVTDAGRAAMAPETQDDPIQSKEPEVREPPNDEAKTEALAKALSGKIGLLVALLQRPAGANISEMMDATGWQAHSVRGAMSGGIKKKLGLFITSQKADGLRTWRIEEAGR